MQLPPPIEQRVVINDNVRRGKVGYLINLIHNIYHEPTTDNADYITDHTCARYDMLCEISEAIVRNDAVALFHDLNTRYEMEPDYEGKPSIANLPAFNGRNIFDLAEERGRTHLAETIKRAGGTSFLVVLRTRDAQDYFIEWHRRAETHNPQIYLDHILQDPNIDPPDLRNVIMAAAVKHALRHEWEACETAFNKYCTLMLMSRELEPGDEADMQALIVAAGDGEQFDLAAKVRDICGAYTGRRSARPSSQAVPSHPAPEML